MEPVSERVGLIAGNGRFPFLLLDAARARGQNVVIVGNFYRGLSASVVLSKTVADKLNVTANAPVQQRLRALDGLTIASPSATSPSHGWGSTSQPVRRR